MASKLQKSRYYNLFFDKPTFFNDKGLLSKDKTPYPTARIYNRCCKSAFLVFKAFIKQVFL